jgi:hypothetical protein
VSDVAPGQNEAAPPAAGERRHVLRRIDELTVRLETRRGLVALWIASTAAIATVALLMHWAALPGWDDAAHVYKVYLLRSGQSVFWDNDWYGGGYGAITYGVLFYWLAQFVPAKLIVVVAGGFVPLFYYLYQRDMWKIADPLPAWLLGGIMAIYLAHGQDPFVLSLALTLGGLALLARGRPLLGALPVAVGVFANPLGFVTCGVFMLADIVARASLRRRYLVFFAALAPFLAARFLLGLSFSQPGHYLNETSELLVYLGFALAGAALAGLNAAHPRRPLVILFFTYAVLCVVSFITPGSPLGNNIGRFFFVFCLPLLFLLRHSRLRRPFPSGDIVMIVVVMFAVLQVGAPYSHFHKVQERPQTRASFFAPALAAAQRLSGPDYRIHVVALRRHWEAYYFPHAGYAITRGWYRQADAIHNELFYTVYDGATYVAWLRSMGVEYVFEPHALVDPWSRREVRILHSSPAFVRVETTGAWTIWRLRDAQPLAVGLQGGAARVTHMGHQDLTMHVDRPGRYLVKVTWTPYWKLTQGTGRVSRAPGDFVTLDAAAPGAYTLRFHVTLGEALGQIGAKLGL